MKDFDDLPADDEADLPAEKSSKAPAVAPEITPEMAAAASMGVDSAFDAINKQPKVRVRVPQVMGPQVVVINGARFNIPSNVSIEVPEQVAQVLVDAGRI